MFAVGQFRVFVLPPGQWGVNRKEGTHHKTSTDLWLFKGMASTDNASLRHVAFLMRHIVANRGTVPCSRASCYPAVRLCSTRTTDVSAARVSNRRTAVESLQNIPAASCQASRGGSRALFTR